MITIEVLKPKIITTFAEGTHIYVKGLTVWNNKEIIVYIYFNDFEVEKKLEKNTAPSKLIVRTKEVHLVESLGLELKNTKLIELS